MRVTLYRNSDFVCSANELFTHGPTFIFQIIIPFRISVGHGVAAPALHRVWSVFRHRCHRVVLPTGNSQQATSGNP